VAGETYDTFDAVRGRLGAIADEVNAEGVSLDEAIALFDEAVKLALQACDMSEEDAEAALAQDESSDDLAVPDDAPSEGGDSAVASDGVVA